MTPALLANPLRDIEATEHVGLYSLTVEARGGTVLGDTVRSGVSATARYVRPDGQLGPLPPDG